jgi:hypothetical protein
MQFVDLDDDCIVEIWRRCSLSGFRNFKNTCMRLRKLGELTHKYEETLRSKYIHSSELWAGSDIDITSTGPMVIGKYRHGIVSVSISIPNYEPMIITETWRFGKLFASMYNGTYIYRCTSRNSPDGNGKYTIIRRGIHSPIVIVHSF